MTQITINQKSLELHYANFITSSYGHKKVIVELFYSGQYKVFSAITTRVDLTDDASELEGDERYMAIYEIIDIEIQDQVIEWMEEIDN